MYSLKTTNFEGPLEKLLELIEERKLEINTVNIAEVTDGFLKYLKTLIDVDRTAVEKSSVADPVTMALIADFIAIASRLILLKSKSLLPDLTLTDEEEKDIKDLEGRLLLYAKVKDAMKLLMGAWESNAVMASRPYFLHANLGAHVFLPGEGLTQEALTHAMRGVLEEFKKWNVPIETIKEKIVSLEEIVKNVVERISHLGGNTTLKGIAGSRGRSELVLIFLAVLHLAREQLIHIEQESHFSDILVRNKKQEERREENGKE